MGLLEGATASIAVRPDTAPRFFKPRPVPYAYKELVEQELRRLERDEIIEAVRLGCSSNTGSKKGWFNQDMR